MIIPSSVTQSIDTNFVDISSAWLWSTSTVYSDTTYTQMLAQPISVEADTLNELRFLDPTTTLTIRKTSDPTSLVLWSGDVTLLPDPVPVLPSAVTMKSAGIADPVPPKFTDLGSGNFTIAACNVNLYSTTNYVGTVDTYAVASASFALAGGTEQYLCIKYNAGTPVYYLESSAANITGSDVIAVYVMWLATTGTGGTLEIHSVSLDSRGIGLINKTADMMTRTQPYTITYNQHLTLNETNAPVFRTVLISSAVVYAGVDPINVLALDSSISGHRLTRVNHVSGVWTYTNTTQYDNQNYDDGTNLVSMGANRYGVRWYYRSIGDDIQCFYTCSGNYSNQTAAEADPVPTGLPPILQDHCVLIGRMIIQKDLNTAVSIENVATTSFQNSSITVHNSLNGLQGNGPDYYHLDATQYTAFGNIPTTYLPRSAGSGNPITGDLYFAAGITQYLQSPIGGHYLAFVYNNAQLGTSPIVDFGAADECYIRAKGFITHTPATGFLKADGSVDLNTYAIAANYLPLAGGAMTGPITSNVNANAALGPFAGPYAFQATAAQVSISLTSTTPVNVNDRNVVISTASGGISIGVVNPTTGVMGAWFQGSSSNGIPTTVRINGDLSVGGGYNTVTAYSFIKPGGTSAQFLKADGSVDSSTYLTTGSAASTYLPLAGGTLTGALAGTTATFSGTITSNNSINLTTTSAPATLYLTASGTGTEAAIQWSAPSTGWILGNRNGISGVPNTALTLWSPAGGGTAYWYQSTTLHQILTNTAVSGTLTVNSTAQIYTYNASTAAWFGYSGFNTGATTGAGFWAWSDGGVGIDFVSSKTFSLRSAGANKLTVDTNGTTVAGKLTVSSYPTFFGATLQAWGSGRNATTLGGTVSMEQVNSSGDYWILHNNCYFDGTNNRSISATGYSTQLLTDPSGNMSFYALPNNGANGIVTFTTKQFNVDASGNGAFTGTVTATKLNASTVSIGATTVWNNAGSWPTIWGTNDPTYGNPYVMIPSLHIPYMQASKFTATAGYDTNGNGGARIRFASDYVATAVYDFGVLPANPGVFTATTALRAGTGTNTGAMMFTWAGDTTVAWFGAVNQNVTTSGNSGYLQRNTGEIYVCAPSGHNINLQYNSLTTAQVGSVGIAAGTNLNAFMGSWVSNASAYAVWCHGNFAGIGASYAMLQDSTGSTYINAASGKNITFQINNASNPMVVAVGGVTISSLSATGIVRAGTGGLLQIATLDDLPYLPLSAGNASPITGDLFVNANLCMAPGFSIVDHLHVGNPLISIGQGISGSPYVNFPANSGNYCFQVAGPATFNSIINASGGIKIVGVTDGSDAAQYTVGEFITSAAAPGAGNPTITSGSVTAMANIPLTSGDWEIWASVTIGTNTTVAGVASCDISAYNGGAMSSDGYGTSATNPVGSGGRISMFVKRRVNIPSPSGYTYYINVQMTGTYSGASCSGSISARRIR